MNTLRIIHREKDGTVCIRGIRIYWTWNVRLFSKLAEYVMDTYLSEPDNTDFAFVAHGSLVPTQFYLYYEILNRSDAKERENLKKYYPMFLRYYRYMAGRTEGSTMSRLEMVF